MNGLLDTRTHSLHVDKVSVTSRNDELVGIVTLSDPNMIFPKVEVVDVGPKLMVPRAGTDVRVTAPIGLWSPSDSNGQPVIRIAGMDSISGDRVFPGNVDKRNYLDVDRTTKAA